MKHLAQFCLIIALLFGSVVSMVLAAGWSTYRSDDYGFQMLVPTGTQFSERDYGGGWGGLEANADGVMIYAVGKLGEHASADEIEDYGVRITGIPASNWKKVAQGTSSNGWKWYKGVEARSGNEVAYGG